MAKPITPFFLHTERRAKERGSSAVTRGLDNAFATTSAYEKMEIPGAADFLVDGGAQQQLGYTVASGFVYGLVTSPRVQTDIDIHF